MELFTNILAGIGGFLIGMFSMSATSWMYDQDWPLWARVLVITIFIWLILSIIGTFFTPTQILCFKICMFVFLGISLIIGILIEGGRL